MRDNSFDTLRKTFSYPGFIRECSVKNEDDFWKVVSGPAYVDFSPRTQKGVKKEQLESVFKWLADVIYNYFKSDVLDYETWHVDTCKGFIKEYENNTSVSINYGKAQKIVNMSMKYVSCFKDAAEKPTKFCNCHMPLDTYTLNWFCEVIVPSYCRGKNTKVSITKIKECGWSKLVCGSKDEEYSYLWIQDLISDYFKSDDNKEYRSKNGTPLTPFEAEFYVWPEQRFKELISALKKQEVLSADFPAYLDENMVKDCTEVVDKLKQLIQLKEKIKSIA